MKVYHITGWCDIQTSVWQSFRRNDGKFATLAMIWTEIIRFGHGASSANREYQFRSQPKISESTTAWSQMLAPAPSRYCCCLLTSCFELGYRAICFYFCKYHHKIDCCNNSLNHDQLTPFQALVSVQPSAIKSSTNHQPSPLMPGNQLLISSVGMWLNNFMRKLGAS